MTFEQATKEGWMFTGMCWDRFDDQFESLYKAAAAHTKNIFKGADYRIVTGSKHSWLSSGSKAIVGNDLFIKFHRFDFDNTLSPIEKFPEQIQEIKKRHQEELERVINAQKTRIELYNEACKISGKRLQISPETYLQTDETVI